MSGFLEIQKVINSNYYKLNLEPITQSKLHLPSRH